MFNQNNNCCKSYKLIFMDLSMPIKDGFQTTKEIYNYLKSQNINKESLPAIVACSGYSLDETTLKKMEHVGLKDYLIKPINR